MNGSVKSDVNKLEPKRPQRRWVSWLIILLLLLGFIRYTSIPVFWAVESGNPTLVKFCLDLGSDANAVNRKGTALLHTAVFYTVDERGNSVQREEIIRLLLNRNAKVNTRTSSGYTPLHFAANFASGGNAIELLTGDQRASVSSESGRRIRIMEMLLEQGADINARDEDGDTPYTVCFASTIGLDFPIVRLGGRSESKNPDLIPVLEFFEKHGADFNARDNEGTTPLGKALARQRDLTPYLARSGMVPIAWAEELAWLRQHGATE